MGLLDKLKPHHAGSTRTPPCASRPSANWTTRPNWPCWPKAIPDARVRRAAICRLSDPGVLGRVAAADADPETRDRAADRLVALATAGPTRRRAVAAVRALADPRRLSAIARSEAADAVRAEALARTTDERALSGIARHAKHEATALAALGRLTDSARAGRSRAEQPTTATSRWRAFERVDRSRAPTSRSCARSKRAASRRPSAGGPGP